MKEIFKDLPGYEGYYQVSNLGHVKSLKREIIRKNNVSMVVQEKMLTPNVSGGYRLAHLRKDNRRYIKVSVLVAMAFLDHKPDGTTKIVVDHINNKPMDDRLENLQLISNRENCSKDRKGSSKYTGVKLRNNRWVANIYTNGKTRYIGSFKNELDASNAYQNKLKEITNVR